MNWDTRYGVEGYLFGKDPAAFLAREAGRIPEGARVLCVADGEGRNSVHLARLGHAVTAFDPSPVAVAKARALAAEAGVEVDFNVASLADWDWSRPVDVLAAIFIQFLDPDARGKSSRPSATRFRPGAFCSCTATRRGRSAMARAGRRRSRTCIPGRCSRRPSRAGTSCIPPITTR